MKKSLLTMFLILIMILSTACNGANSQSSSVASAQESSPAASGEEEPYYGEIALFSLPELKANTAELVGVILMEDGGELKYTVEAETGTGFFIACSKEEQETVAADAFEWLYYAESKEGNTIEAVFDPTEAGEYYIYLGSLGTQLDLVYGSADWTPADIVAEKAKAAAEWAAAQGESK